MKEFKNVPVPLTAENLAKWEENKKKLGEKSVIKTYPPDHDDGVEQMKEVIMTNLVGC